MNPDLKCNHCGVGLPIYSNDGLCPSCMLRSALEGFPEDESSLGSRLALPRLFGAYELLEEIGRGGIGIVYRARQGVLERTVALKLLLGGAYSSEAMLRRFQIEAGAAASLQHPGIVAIHDYGEHEGQPFYTMELMEGQNLAEISGGRPLQTRRAAEYLHAIATAVQYAHERQIIHRDLKPSNVLLDRNGRPRVADFGMAKRLDLDHGMTMTGQMVGSPNYVAPEQAAGREGEFGAATDIYALGALLYHLLTGRPPFLAATLEETIRLLHTTEPVSPRVLNPGVPRDLETICIKCLTKEPAGRYATAAAMADDLGRFLSDRPIHARPPNLVYRARKYARRNRTIVVAATAVFLSIAAGLGAALAGFRRAVEQQRTTQIARAQAEELISLLVRDVQPALAPYGRLPVLKRIAEEALRYFEQLPADLRDDTAKRGLATAWESLATIHKREGNESAAQAAGRTALALRQEIAEAQPADPENAAALLVDERWAKMNLNGTPEERGIFQEELIRKHRELLRRFPDNLTVKQELATILNRRGWESTAAGKEARELWQQILEADPKNKAAHVEYAYSLQVLANTYSTINFAESIALSQQAVEYADGALKTDPGNLQLLEIAAQTAIQLSYRVAKVSFKRASEAEIAARERFQQLVQLDPVNEEWRKQYARAHWMEANYLFLDGRLEEAREIYQKLDALGEALSEAEAFAPNLRLAEIAAIRGRGEETRAQLEIGRREFQVVQDKLSANAFSRDLAFRTWWQGQCDVSVALHDWPALERSARRLLEQATNSTLESPLSGEKLVGQGVAASGNYFLGTALLRQGRRAESIKVLWEVVNHDLSAVDAIDSLAEALLQNGEMARARSILEQGLPIREADMSREPDFWTWKRKLARTSYLLAAALNAQEPADAVRRATLLERAAEFLKSPDATTRITRDEYELQAEIARLGTAASSR